MLNQIASLTIGNHKIDMLINISRDAFGTYDFYKSKEIIQVGESAALRAIDSFAHCEN